MSNHNCACCGTGGEPKRVRSEGSHHWITTRPVTDAALPDPMTDALQPLFGVSTGDTLGNWANAIGSVVDEDNIGVDDLCHADEATPHRARMTGETYHFLCFFDAVLLAVFEGNRVEIATETPSGRQVEIVATDQRILETTPSDLVVSFGVTADLPEPRDGEYAPEDVYGSVCPYVKAFESRSEYEAWTESVDAVTVGFPLDDSWPFVDALVETE